VTRKNIDMTEEPAPYGGATNPLTARRRTRVHHLLAMKERGEKWAMLTAYDQYTAAIFDDAGIPVLLVGDSASNNVFGNETSLPVTVDQLIPLVRAVTRSARHALVVADLPFGSYQGSPEQAFSTCGALHEGGRRPRGEAGGRPADGAAREAPRGRGIPVMAHIGFTPQAEHRLGGYRVQGRGDAAKALIEAAEALADAGAFAVVLEMVPPTWPRSSPARSPSPRSASAPVRAPTRRSSSGRTWRAADREASPVRQAVRRRAR
jgi:3-methyl-2-oxobutanoate hydroxymethyltransferase